MAPTRFPNGISFIKPGVASGSYTFVAGDQTPDVSLGTVFFTAASAITITRFDGGERGKVICVICNTGGAVTIQNSAGGINITNIVASNSAGYLYYSATAGNAVLLNNEAATFVHNGTDWSYTGTRLVYNTQ